MLNLYDVIIHALNSQEFMGKYPGGYDFKVFIAPFVLLFGELFLWFKLFRYLAHPSRIFAGLIGGYIFLMAIFVNLIISDLYDKQLPNSTIWFYVYSGIGHLAYAFFGKESNA